MSNKELSGILKTMSMLLALHDENQFKVKMYDSASQLIKNSQVDFSKVDSAELETYDGIGKKIAADIEELREKGTTDEFQKLLESTPAGLIEVLNLKGIGPKKVRALWKELQVESLEDVILECEKGTIASLKGFGEKTQEKIKAIAEFNISTRGQLLFAEAEQLVSEIMDRVPKLKLTGQMVRGLDVVSVIQFLVEDRDLWKELESLDFLEHQKQQSSPFTWRGKDQNTGITVEVFLSDNIEKDHFVYTSAPAHLNYSKEGQSIGSVVRKESGGFDVNELYKKFELPYIPAGSREGVWEFGADKERVEHLIEEDDLKGIIHNHSTWSDGQNSIEEMALECKALGYEYFGISDHSKSAFYANGLYEDRIEKQQQEVDDLNKKLSGITIFKGIEADILNDGALDYSDDVLATFDYVVASIHSVLDMDLEKSMARLIKAIENPYTTILGHLTGRLLLRREGYPVNHKMIIDACAENKVIIELNANPWRLDMDWRYIDYAMEKGVMLSINPDAHSLNGIKDVKYGVISARKGGLTPEFCLNTRGVKEVQEIFQKKIKEAVVNG